jgi:hypothetical protein
MASRRTRPSRPHRWLGYGLILGSIVAGVSAFSHAWPPSLTGMAALLFLMFLALLGVLSDSHDGEA